MADKQTTMKVLLQGIDRLSPVLKNVQTKLAITERRLKQFGRGGMVMGAGIAGGAAVALRAFSDMENAQAKLASAMMQKGGKVPAVFAQLNQLAEQLGDKLPGTTADFERMMGALVKNGTEAQDILNGVGTATAYLAVKLDMATDQAAVFSAKLKSALNAPASDMMNVLDVIQRLEGVGIEPEKQLSAFAALKPVLSSLKQEGSAAAKALAPLLVMNKEIQGETVGIAISKLVRLGLNAKKTKDVNAMLAPGGIKLDFTDGHGGFGGIEKMFQQMAKLRKLTPQQFQTIMPKLFGDDAQTLQVLSSIVQADYQTYKDIQSSLMSQATLQEKVGSELNTLQNKTEAAAGTFTNFLAAIGKVYEKDIKQWVDNFGELSAKMREFVEANPQMVRSVTAMAVAITAVKVAALAAAHGIRLMSLALASSPVGLLVTALAAGAGYVIANWETMPPSFHRIWDKVVAGLNKLKQAFAFYWDGIQSDMEGLKNALNFYWDGIQADAEWLWDKLGKGWDATMESVYHTINGLSRTWEDTKDAIFSIWDAMERKWHDLVEGFKSGLGWLGHFLPTAYRGMIGGGTMKVAYGGGFMPANGQDRFTGFGGDIEQVILSAASRFGVDPALIRAVIKAESGGNARAVSSAGAGGLMQLMPATAKRFGVNNRFDPAQNIMGGTAYLSFLLKRYRGDYTKAIGAYNAGEGNIDKGRYPAETRAYIPKVLGYMRQQRIQGGLDITFRNAPPGTEITKKPGKGGVNIRPKMGYRTLGRTA